MKKLAVLILAFIFLGITSCTEYNEASDNISITVNVADIDEILKKLNENELENQKRFNELNSKLILMQGDLAAIKISQDMIARTLSGNTAILNQYQEYFLRLMQMGTSNEASIRMILEILNKVQAQLLEIGLTQKSQGEDLKEIKEQTLKNYLILLEIASNLKEVKEFAIDNKDQLVKLLTLFGGLENLQKMILDNLINQGLSQTRMFEMLIALGVQMSEVQTVVDYWGNFMISEIGKFGLTLGQQGIVLANLLVNSNNLLGNSKEIFLKLEQILTLTGFNENNSRLILGVLSEVYDRLLEIGLTQKSQGEDLKQIKEQVLKNYLILVELSGNLKEVKEWTLDNKDQLTKLVALFGNLQNLQNIILDNLINQGLSQARMLEMLNSLGIQMKAIQGSVDYWGTLIISRINELGLTLQQQGITLAKILANTENLKYINVQIIAKLDKLQLSADELKILHLSSIEEIAQIKNTLINLQQVVNNICAQVLMLKNGQEEILIAINTKLCDNSTHIYNSYEYTFNEFIDQTTSINQVYNACSNGLGGCNNGAVPPANVCMSLNVMNSHIVGNENNVNYNFVNLKKNKNSTKNKFGC